MKTWIEAVKHALTFWLLMGIVWFVTTGLFAFLGWEDSRDVRSWVNGALVAYVIYLLALDGGKS